MASSSSNSGKAVPSLVLFFAGLCWAQRTYSINKIALAAIAIVGASMTCLYGTFIGPMLAITLGTVGLIFSYDLRQLSKNVHRVINDNSLKDLTAISSGWGIQGFYNVMVTQVPKAWEFSKEMHGFQDDLNEALQQKFSEFIVANKDRMKQNLIQDMTPLGTYLMQQLFNLSIGKVYMSRLSPRIST